jgi:hypothetical protein
MKKEFQEPEEKGMDIDLNDAKIDDDFNPLDEAIIEKAYTKPNIRFSDKDMTGDIPEPSFIPPPLGGSLVEEERIKKPQEPPLNKEMNDLPKKDKHDAADKVAKMILGGYKMANQFVDKKLLFDEKKISKMQMDGEIDLSVIIPISQNENITADEFIKEFNQQSEGTITVTKEFEDEVTPVLTRVLEKRGIGMTDEQFLIYLFGKDIAMKGFMVSQSLSAKKEMLIMLKEASVGMNKNSNNTEQFKGSTKNESNTQPDFKNNSNDVNEVSDLVDVEIPTVNEVVNQMTGGYVNTPKHTTESEVKILNLDNGVNTGKRGRPKKNK